MRALSLALIGAGLLLLGALALLYLPRVRAGSEKELSVVPSKVDYAAPELALTDLQGKPVSLADYRGQVVLVNHWATWCPPCKAEMPDLEAYYQDHRQQNFVVVAIEAGEPADEVAEFVRAYQLTFPIWLDPTLKAMAAFRYPGLPTSYVIDRQGNVVLVWTGAIQREALEKYVTPLLEN